MDEALKTPDSPRPVVCLIVDEQTLERIPTALRYLLVGLIDECIDTVLVAPETPGMEALVTLPTRVIPQRERHWPLGGWGRYRVVGDVLRALNERARETMLIVHSLQPRTTLLAMEIAAAAEGDVLATVSSEHDIPLAAAAKLGGRAPLWTTPSLRLRDALLRSSSGALTVEVLPFGAVVPPSTAAFSSPQFAPTLVAAGDLNENRGLEPLLKAIKLVRQDYPSLLTFVIGKGPAEPDLRQLATMLDLQSSVTFTGRCEHLRTVLQSADIFFVPRSEPLFREEPLQASATGLAIIAPDDAPYDWFKDGETALLFSENDEDRIAERLHFVLSDRAQARRLAMAGQAAAKAQYSIARMVAEHVRVYRRLESRRKTLAISAAR